MYKIPRDLHPRLPSEEFVMSDLPDDAIGVYHCIFDFSGVRIPFSSFLLALIKHYKVHFSRLGPLGLNKVVTFEFSFAKRRASSLVCIDDNRSCMKRWKSGFFLIDRRAIPDYISWRHPDSAINDLKPPAGCFNMEDVRRLSAHVVKLKDMPEGVLVLSGLSHVLKSQTCDSVLRVPMEMWTGAEVQEEPYHDIRPTLQRLPFYYTPHAAVVAKDEASQKRKASTFGATSSHVAKHTSDDDNACVEIPLVTPICSAVVIPSSGNQVRGFVAPATEDSRGKGIMTDAAATSSAGVNRPRPSSDPASSFKDISRDAIHKDFFPFSPGRYYATYPEGGVAGNY
ncbi:hypothetical protein Tco_1280491, partial [Tanacetum coccineum]